MKINPDRSNFWLLRWRFDFVGSASKFGIWSRPSNVKSEMAAFHNKEGLALASIEGKNFLTRQVKILASVPGQDFLNFQWLATASGLSTTSGGNPVTALVGLAILDRESATKVFVDGSTSIEKHNVDNINFATFGK